MSLSARRTRAVILQIACRESGRCGAYPTIQDMPSSEHMAFRDVDAPSAADPAVELAGRRVILTIGIDQYEEWPVLQNAVSDALGAHALFTALGFQEVVPPVVNRAATGRALRELVTDELSRLGVHDSLVVFFAGHGHVRARLFGGHKTGYLIPTDGDRRIDSWLRLDVWLDEIAQLPPRHILVILDACHSGIALGDIIHRSASDSADADGALDQRRSRRVITSALDHQRAQDAGPVPGHSLFTGCLLEGLPHGFGDRGHAITGSELGIRLQRCVSEYSQHTQTPDVGAFGLDNRGEMMIPLAAVPPIGPARPPDPASARPQKRPIQDLGRLIPVLGDFLDARAAVRRPGGAGAVSSAGLLAVAVIWLAQARPLLGVFLDGTPAYLTWIASPAAVMLGCLYLLCARDLGGRRYRCDPRLRTAAKLAGAVAAAVLAVRVRHAVVDERASLFEGYVCGDDGRPVTTATAQLVDANGQRIGEANHTERAGYVWLTAPPWSFRPLTAVIEVPRCRSLAVSLDAAPAGGCPAATGIARHESEHRRLPIWRDPCAD